MKNLKHFRFLISFLVLTLSWESVIASSVPPKVPVNEAVTIATVNLQNFKFMGQDNNTLTLAFDISNRVGVVPEVLYSVVLLQKDIKGNLSTVDTKLYENDTIFLGENTLVHKEIAYVAPLFLHGNFVLTLQAQNSNGLVYSTLVVPNEVSISPIQEEQNKERFIFSSEKCYLTVSSDEYSLKYDPLIGVDIAKDETLTAHCTVKSTFSTSQKLSIFSETRYHTSFGKLIEDRKLSEINLSPNENTEVSVNLRNLGVPQEYFAVLSLRDTTNMTVSPPVSFHFFVRGDAAMIQNVTLDKKLYQKGDNAKVTLFWGRVISPVLRSRAEVPAKMYAQFLLLDSANNACSEMTSKELTSESQNIITSFIPVIHSCDRSVLSVKIVDSKGVVLAENQYKLQKMTLVKNISSKILSYRIFSLLIILLALLLAWHLRNKKNSSMIALFALFVSLGLLGGGHVAHADTFMLGPATFNVSLDKSTYYQGEDILMSGSMSEPYPTYISGADYPVGSPSAGPHVTVGRDTRKLFETQFGVDGYFSYWSIPFGASGASYTPSHLWSVSGTVSDYGGEKFSSLVVGAQTSKFWTDFYIANPSGTIPRVISGFVNLPFTITSKPAIVPPTLSVTYDGTSISWTSTNSNYCEIAEKLQSLVPNKALMEWFYSNQPTSGSYLISTKPSAPWSGAPLIVMVRCVTPYSSITKFVVEARSNGVPPPTFVNASFTPSTATNGNTASFSYSSNNPSSCVAYFDTSGNDFVGNNKSTGPGRGYGSSSGTFDISSYVHVGNSPVTARVWCCTGSTCLTKRVDLTVTDNVVVGSCGSANNHTFAASETSYNTYTQCSGGVADNFAFPSQGGNTTWACMGSGGGVNSSTCSAGRLNPAVAGSCGTADGFTFPSTATNYGVRTQCSVGSSTDTAFVDPVTGLANWSCLGTNGGSNAACSASKIINGVCGSANGKNVLKQPSSSSLCLSGTAGTVTKNALSKKWVWKCSGTSGGSNSNCSAKSGQLNFSEF